MYFGAVRLVVVIVVGFLPASGLAQDVTGSEPPSETTLMMEDSVGLTGTSGMTSTEILGPTPDPAAENQTEIDSVLSTMASSLPVSVLEHQETTTIATVNISSSQPDFVSSELPESTIVPDETNTTTPQQTTSSLNHSTVTVTTSQPSTTTTSLATTLEAVETTTTSVPATTLTHSTSGTPTPTTISVTQPPTTVEITTRKTQTTESPSTTRRSTTLTPHECVTSSSCNDPNAHCVNRAGRNTCQCRLGFRRNSPSGRCLLIEQPSTTVPTTTTTTEKMSTTAFPIQTTTSSPLLQPGKKDKVRRASDLNKYETLDVVSIALLPTTSVVEWLLERDLSFRRVVAEILSSTNFSLTEDFETVKTINVTAEQVLYVAPSPQVTLDGLLVSFLVQDKEGITAKYHSSRDGIIARYKRDLNSTDGNVTGYVSSTWIVTALRNSQNRLEMALNQTVGLLHAGGIPDQLYSIEQFTAATLFERRLDIFIPLILVAALCFMGLAVSLVCIRAKTRSMATWDPPAGVVFGKTSIKKENREDPLGCIGKPDAVGHHLATDEQCRDGEEQLMKHSTRIHADDDVWVVPYDDGPSQGQPSHVKTQYEDTKL